MLCELEKKRGFAGDFATKSEEQIPPRPHKILLSEADLSRQKKIFPSGQIREGQTCKETLERWLVRSPGFEPGSSAWEADVLAKLDYDRYYHSNI